MTAAAAAMATASTTHTVTCVCGKVFSLRTREAAARALRSHTARSALCRDSDNTQSCICCGAAVPLDLLAALMDRLHPGVAYMQESSSSGSSSCSDSSSNGSSARLRLVDRMSTTSAGTADDSHVSDIEAGAGYDFDGADACSLSDTQQSDVSSPKMSQLSMHASDAADSDGDTWADSDDVSICSDTDVAQLEQQENRAADLPLLETEQPTDAVDALLEADTQ